MKVLPARISSKQTVLELSFVVILGLVAAKALIVSMGMGTKWSLFVIIAMVSSAAVMMTPRREKLLLYLTVFFLPVALDVNLFYIDLPHGRSPIYGIRIAAADLPFFLLLGLWVLRIAFGTIQRVRLYPWISIPFFCIWCVSIFVSLFSSASGPAPAVITVGALWLMFKHWLLCIYIANAVKDRRTLFMVMGVLLAGGVLQSLLGYLQYFTGSGLGMALLGQSQSSLFVMKAGAGTVSRVAGTFGHPNKFALYLGMLLQLNFALFFAPTGRTLRLVLAVPFILMAGAMVLTFSRGGWLGLAVGGAITAYWCISRRTRHKVMSAFLCILLLASLMVSLIILVEPVRRRLFGSDYGTAGVRPPLARVALNMIRHKPLTGVGIGNYTLVMGRYDNTKQGITKYFPAPVHNEFLLVAAELGIIAAGLFIFILGVLFKNLLAMGRSRELSTQSFMAIGFFGAWLGWCLHNQFEYQYIFYSGLMWFYVGLILAVKDQISAFGDRPENKERLQRASVGSAA